MFPLKSKNDNNNNNNTAKVGFSIEFSRPAGVQVDPEETESLGAAFFRLLGGAELINFDPNASYMLNIYPPAFTIRLKSSKSYGEINKFIQKLINIVAEEEPLIRRYSLNINFENVDQSQSDLPVNRLKPQ